MAFPEEQLAHVFGKTFENNASTVASATFVAPHDIPEGATFLGKFADEYSPTDASAVYEVDSGMYVKTPVEP